MAPLDKAVEKLGLDMVADRLPREKHTIKEFQRLIAAVRAAEGKCLDELDASRARENDALRELDNLRKDYDVLKDRVRELEKLIDAIKLREKLDSVEALTTEQKAKLLGNDSEAA